VLIQGNQLIIQEQIQKIPAQNNMQLVPAENAAVLQIDAHHNMPNNQPANAPNNPLGEAANAQDQFFNNPHPQANNAPQHNPIPHNQNIDIRRILPLSSLGINTLLHWGGVMESNVVAYMNASEQADLINRYRSWVIDQVNVHGLVIEDYYRSFI
jgi:hypothetical protein